MTATPPDAGIIAAPAPGDEAACRLAAKRLREKYPRWVVIWVPRTARYHAYPLAGTRAGTGLTDTEPAGLAAQIEQAQRAITSRRAGPRASRQRRPNSVVNILPVATGHISTTDPGPARLRLE